MSPRNIITRSRKLAARGRGRAQGVMVDARVVAWYTGRLKLLTRGLKDLATEAVGDLRSSWPVAKDTDTPAKVALRKFKKGAEKLSEQAIADAREMTAKTRKSVENQLVGIVGAKFDLDIRPLISATSSVSGAIADSIAWNTSLIKSISENFHDRLAKDIEEAWTSGKRVESLADKIEENYGVSASRAELIARDQVSKLTGDVNRTRQQEVGITEYEWVCNKDERTRKSHLDVNGMRFRWADPGPVAGSVDGEPCHPQEDIECRCFARPVFDAIMES